MWTGPRLVSVGEFPEFLNHQIMYQPSKIEYLNKYHQKVSLVTPVTFIFYPQRYLKTNSIGN